MNLMRVGFLAAVAALAVYFGLSHFFPHQRPAAALKAESGTVPVVAPASGQIPPLTPAPAPAAGEKPLTADEARKIAEEVGRKVGTQVAQEMLDKDGTPAAAEPERPAAPPAPTPQQAPVHPATPAPEAESAPAARPPRVKIARPAVEKSQQASVASKADKPKPEPDFGPIAAWWPDPAQRPPGALNLMFAGEAASERAVALLFSNAFSDAAAAGSHLLVLNAAGVPQKGAWRLAPNPRMLMFRVETFGRYTVVIGADLADAKGVTLGSPLRGPVLVH